MEVANKNILLKISTTVFIALEKKNISEGIWKDIIQKISKKQAPKISSSGFNVIF